MILGSYLTLTACTPSPKGITAILDDACQLNITCDECHGEMTFNAIDTNDLIIDSWTTFAQHLNNGITMKNVMSGGSNTVTV